MPVGGCELSFAEVFGSAYCGWDRSHFSVLRRSTSPLLNDVPGEIHQGSVVENVTGRGSIASTCYGMSLLACEVAFPFFVCS